jgi:CrcB protein
VILAVAAAAFVGGICRYMLDLVVERHTASVLPLGTLAVNATGSLALGFVAGLALHHGLGAGSERVLGTGFLGAYTTFSTFSYETFRLAEDGAHRQAFLNAAANVGVGLAAAALGLFLASAG